MRHSVCQLCSFSMLHLSWWGTADSGGWCIEECCPASAPGKIPQLQQQGNSCCQEQSASYSSGCTDTKKHLKHGITSREVAAAPTYSGGASLIEYALQRKVVRNNIAANSPEFSYNFYNQHTAFSQIL